MSNSLSWNTYLSLLTMLGNSVMHREKISHKPAISLYNCFTYSAEVRNKSKPLVFQKRAVGFLHWRAEQLLSARLNNKKIKIFMKKRALGFSVCIISNTGYTNSCLQETNQPTNLCYPLHWLFLPKIKSKFFNTRTSGGVFYQETLQC